MSACKQDQRRFGVKEAERRGAKTVTLFLFSLKCLYKTMKLVTNIQKQPLLLLNSGQVINLNTLENTKADCLFPVKAGKKVKISKHKNSNKFLEKAGKLFSVSKVSKNYGTSWYKLEAQIVIFCTIQGENVQLIGNYPLYYLKLLYRYINSL